jgi:gas vesicle protein
MGLKLITRTFAFGAAVGAAVMYLADPEGGRQRRQGLKHKADETARQYGVDLDAKAEEVKGQVKDKVQGAAAEATRSIRDSGPGDDNTLADRVRTEVMSDPRFKGLNIDVVDGNATVRGTVEPAEARSELVSRIHRVPGIDRVIDLTHAEGTPAPNL